MIAFAAAGCSAGVQQPQADAGAETIACALGKAAEFSDDCLVERVAVDGKRVLIVRHRDGGFRRFGQVDDGRGLTVLDGAGSAKLSLSGTILEIGIEGDRYRFPAHIRANTNYGADSASVDRAAGAALDSDADAVSSGAGNRD